MRGEREQEKIGVLYEGYYSTSRLSLDNLLILNKYF